MKVWTADDPGAGDMSVIDDWQTSANSQAGAFNEAIATIERLTASALEHWEGAGVTAFVEALGRRSHRLTLMADACVQSASAAGEYAGSVRKIHDDSLQWQLKSRTASAVMTGPDSSVRKPAHARNPDRAAQQEKYEAAQESVAGAEKDFAEAAEQLDELAEARHVADQAFMGAVSSQMSGKLETNHSAYERMDDDDHQKASIGAAGLVALFFAGKLPRDIPFSDDFFTKAIADSGHVRWFREGLIRDLEKGELSEGQIGAKRREASDHVPTLINDMANGATGGVFGNLPESMLGSFAMSYEVIEVEDGKATVTFTVTNDTTRDSMNRIPKVDFMEAPWAGTVNWAHDEYDRFQSSGQTVVWTEAIEVK